ncbi:LAQU0S26e00694g1_1 [Lachancea quebecensis]|uniref:LAQU0S26e00694g1_1 n=1 Tax=Lachancea quebecensis TaxID=1654605 RepID=A0A0P1L3V3_9SACH|nr:LAQU0S26e00694g1_1 [Lachancea quebecensis]
METDKVSSVSERLQLLMDVNHEQHDRSSGSLLTHLISTLDQETTAPTTLIEEAPSPQASATERTFTANSYYTSFVPARPHADYFDFDTEYNEKAKDIYGDVEEVEAAAGHSSTGADRHHETLKESSLELSLTEPLADDPPDDADQNVQMILDKLDTFKREFRLLIQRMDEASLVSRISGFETLPDMTARPRVMNTLVGDIIDTLQSFVPQPSRKRSRRDSDVGIAEKEEDDSLLDVVAKETLENDPCYGVPNFGVVLIKSPTTVSQLWNEYTKLPSEWALPDWFDVASQQSAAASTARKPAILLKRRTSIRDLERVYGSSWRNGDKNFSRQVNRRKKIWHAIEEGLESGIPLEECFTLLESYVKERGKGLSWYYNGVPFKLSDLRARS